MAFVLPTEGMLFYLWFVPLSIWSLIWTGISLWKSSRNNQMRWFVLLLILNTAGLLEIIYLVWFQKKHKKAYFWSKK